MTKQYWIMISGASLAGCIIMLSPVVVQAQNPSSNDAAVVSSSTQGAKEPIKYNSARPLQLPIATEYRDSAGYAAMSAALGAAPGGISPSAGAYLANTGTGVKRSTQIPPSAYQETGLVPFQFGTSNLPFTTSRADLDPIPTNDQYPYRAAGKLFFNKGNTSYICSASLIKPGLVLTAAHCVSDFGKNTYYTDFEFHPGFRNNTSPYGKWTAARAFVLKSYLDGSDQCSQAGVVCQNDIAILALNSQKVGPAPPFYAGKLTGWFAVAWDRAGFTPQSITHVTQLGYPGCLDNAILMQRNDAQASIDLTSADNTVMGSLMCGGSSGGPVLVNFGVQSGLTGTSPGQGAVANAVVGVTSWGSRDNGVKWMGASPFKSSNIVKLVETACAAYPDACKDP